jgi:hypothetical protein
VDQFVSTLQSSNSPLTYSVYGVIYRVGEAIDSIHNFQDASGANLTDTQVATFLVCGISQLGGIMFTAVAATALLLSLLCCIPGLVLGTCCFRSCLWGLGMVSSSGRRRVRGGRAAVRRWAAGKGGGKGAGKGAGPGGRTPRSFTFTGLTAASGATNRPPRKPDEMSSLLRGPSST